MLVIVVGGVGAYWLYGNYSRISHLDAAVRSAVGDLAGSNPNLPVAKQPAIALVMGSDHRWTDGASSPSRSDTLMLVRLDPRTHLISMLSLPRDLWVNIPGVGYDKINAAFTDGGPKLALKTVEAVTGVRPQYLVITYFHGFTSLVNNIGGVYLPIDQNYQHSNAGLPSYLTYSAIHIPPGYQLVDGQNALAYARYRHTDSDFYRNARQQTFLRAFEQAAANQFHGISLTDLPSIKNVIDTISRNVQIATRGGGVGWHTLLDYATLAYSLHGHIISTRLHPAIGTSPAGASIVTDTPQDMHAAVHAFLHPQLVHRPTALPAKPKPAKFKPKTTPSSVSLALLNGTTRAGLAHKTTTALHTWGYHTKPANAPTTGYQRTWVYYRSGFASAASDVVRILGVGYPAAVPAKFHQHTDLVIVLSSDYHGTLALAAPKSTALALPSDMKSTRAYLAEFRSAAHQAHLPGLYPTIVNQSSTLQDFSAAHPIRTYTIKAAGSTTNSLYAYWQYAGTPGSYWGIEETHFDQAPILANPSATRHLDGRTYNYYTNGSHIHLIAITDPTHHIAYWIQNTLMDDLSNTDMTATARSLQPTG